MVQQASNDSGSDSEVEAWSFDKAINEVFRLLPQGLCPKPLEKHTPAKPLSGIEQLMESRPTQLLVLPQSKLVENTAKFIQNKLSMENFGKDWICPQNLVSSLGPMKFTKARISIFQRKMFLS